MLEAKVGSGFVVRACEGVGDVHFWRLWMDYHLLRVNVRALVCVLD